MPNSPDTRRAKGKARSTTAPAQTGRRLRFGVIGAGGIALRRTIPGMLKAANCDLVAVMNPSRVDAIAKHFHVPAAYQDERDLLADPRVEAVYIASPVHCHLGQIRRAAEAGKHILGEKPLTLNPRQTRAAIDACEANGVRLQIGFMMRFHGAHRRIKELIDAGQLGRIVYLRAQLSCWHPPISNGWRQDPATGGGGSLIDMATHLYDLIEYFAGPIARVTALTSNLVQPYPSEDSSTTLLELACGAHATVDCFFCIPDDASRTRLEIYGSAGSILAEGTIGQGVGGRLEGLFGRTERPYRPAQGKDVGAKFKRIPYKRVNTYTAQCEYFARCVLDGDAILENGPESAMHSADLTAAAYRSARLGRVVGV